MIKVECRIGTCIWSIDGVLSLREVDTSPLPWLEFMFFKKRIADSETARTPRPERLKVHVSWGGVFTLVEARLFETEVGQRVLREAEELERRLRGKPSTKVVATATSDRPPCGD